MNLRWMNIAAVAGAALIALVAVWFFFFRSTPPPQGGDTPGGGFTVDNTTNTTVGTGGNTNTGSSTNVPTPTSQQAIFKIAEGPVAGAMFIQSGVPTTTLARYIMADSGHALELAVDVPGAVPRPVSNTTIPGIVQTLWAAKGRGAVVQYISGGVIKTAHLGFSALTATSSTRALQSRIQFLPDNIASVAVSPDGTQAAYLLTTQTGVDGYIAAVDGGNSAKLFSIPLQQVILSWPSSSLLMVQSKAATGVLGIAFSVNAKTGAVAQLVHAEGLTASANIDFSKILYTTLGTGGRETYVHDARSGGDVPLSFQPLPEKCAWSALRTTLLYCAGPLSPVPQNYLDLWHQGTASAADSLFVFNGTNGASTVLATPGEKDGGVPSDITNLSISPDGRYLLFIAKGTRSLWGVRLGQ